MTHKKLRAKYFWFQFIFGIITIGSLYSIAYYFNVKEILPSILPATIVMPLIGVLFFIILISVKYSVKYICPSCKNNILQEDGNFCKNCGFDLSQELQEKKE